MSSMCSATISIAYTMRSILSITIVISIALCITTFLSKTRTSSLMAALALTPCSSILRDCGFLCRRQRKSAEKKPLPTPRGNNKSGFLTYHIKIENEPRGIWTRAYTSTALSAPPALRFFANTKIRI